MSYADKELYEFADFRLQVSERILLKKGKRVALPDKAFEILCLLIRENNHLLEKDELLEKVWAGAFVEENNLDKNISNLRQVLGERRGKQKFIETVRGRGYRFVAEVKRVAVEDAESERRRSDAKSNKETASPKVAALPPRRPIAASQTGKIVALADWRLGE
jgi:DNA-binding winged helix-turn-helix (wHTH) protein